MSFLRNLASDLVEKKLWPFAAVLLIALVAVPVVLGGGSGDPAPAPAANSPATPRAATADAGQAEVSLDDAATTRRHRAGSVRDPFAQQHEPSAASTATATAPAPAGATPSTSGGSRSTPSAGTPSAITPTAPSASTPAAPKKADPLDAYRVSLRFGPAGKQRTLRDVARLSPLPSTDAPFFVYLGVLDDLKTAVFLISSDVKATGDGTCRPRKTDCQTIELRAGDTEFFDFGDDEDVRQYQMDVLKVARHTATTRAVAARAHKRQSKKGRATLQLAKSAGIAPGAYRYSYDRRLGVLHRVSKKAAAKSAKAHPAPRASSGDPLYVLRRTLALEAIKLAQAAAKHKR